MPAFLTLNQLVSTTTQASVLGTELAIASGLGLPVTSWQPVDAFNQLFQINAQIVAQYSSIVNLIAQGGYASYAAQIVDGSGNPVPGWLDLIGQSNYNVQRIQATQANVDSTGFSITNNSGGAIGPYAAGALRVVNPTTGATYRNQVAIGSVANGSTVGVAIVADASGSAGTSGPGTITQLFTPIIGVTCSNSKQLLGSDAQSNQAYFAVCQAKLQSLSVGSPSGAYFYYANQASNPTLPTGAANPFYTSTLSQPITRVSVQSAPAAVTVYLANSGGAPNSTDTSLINTVIQTYVVPSGTVAVVQPAPTVTVPISYTLYLPASAGVSVATAQSQISTALTNYFAALPIGGLRDQNSNVVPYSGLIATIKNAVPQSNAVTVSSPSGDVVIASNAVATLGQIMGSVVLV